jgi:hypothetical protein
MQATTAVPAYSGPEVEYEVTGNVHAVSVTLGNATGGTEQYNNYALPFRMSYNSFPASFLYISAQNQGEGGYVTVNIYYEGQLIKTSTSSGSYTIATASDYK